MPLARILPVILFVSLLFLLSACSKPSSNPPSIGPQACRDLERMPQDLMPFARQAVENRPLISSGEQSFQAKRTVRLFYAPWSASNPEKGLDKLLKANFGLQPKKGFSADLRPFSPGEWRRLEENANAKAFPSRSQYAIAVRDTSLRAMPSNKPYFLNPSKPNEGYPFDYFQQSALHIGSPLYICHISRDNRWVFAQSNLASGWLPLEDTALVDQAFMNDWMACPLAAIVRDKILLKGEGREARRITGKPSGLTANIGALLPIGTLYHDGGMQALIPKRSSYGRAEIARIHLMPYQARPLPVPATPGAVARIGNEMMAQPYGWGGLDGNRDCSAMMHDLFVPFGIWLPRHSTAQAASGNQITLAGLEAADKQAVIMDNGIPFLSLIWLPGHIGLYIGLFENKPAIFHNLWGLRINLPGQTKPGNGRAVIGRAAITTLHPGIERPDLSSPNGILDRIEKLVNLPGAHP